MKSGICYLVGAGENYGLDFQPAPGDYVIAVDAGYRFLEERGIRVDLAVGDFDTLRRVPSHPNVIALEAEKEDTDMRAALREGIRAGYGRFHIYGGTGGRLDHTLANLQLLAGLAQQGLQGFLIDRDSVATAIADRALVFPKELSGYLSIFAHSGRAEGVCLRGLKYELTDAVLTDTYPLGISNEFLGVRSTVSVGSGSLLIFFPRAGCFPTGDGTEDGAGEPGADVDALVALLDGAAQAGESRIRVDVVEGEGGVVSRQYHHGRCDIGSPWACGTAFDVLEDA